MTMITTWNVPKKKYRIISDVVKEMRRIDPTRPICFDSTIKQKNKDKKYGADFYEQH